MKTKITIETGAIEINPNYFLVSCPLCKKSIHSNYINTEAMEILIIESSIEKVIALNTIPILLFILQMILLGFNIPKAYSVRVNPNFLAVLGLMLNTLREAYYPFLLGLILLYAGLSL